MPGRSDWSDVVLVSIPYVKGVDDASQIEVDLFWVIAAAHADSVPAESHYDTVAFPLH